MKTSIPFTCSTSPSLSLPLTIPLITYFFLIIITFNISFALWPSFFFSCGSDVTRPLIFLLPTSSSCHGFSPPPPSLFMPPTFARTAGHALFLPCRSSLFHHVHIHHADSLPPFSSPSQVPRFTGHLSASFSAPLLLTRLSRPFPAQPSHPRRRAMRRRRSESEFRALRLIPSPLSLHHRTFTAAGRIPIGCGASLASTPLSSLVLLNLL